MDVGQDPTLADGESKRLDVHKENSFRKTFAIRSAKVDLLVTSLLATKIVLKILWKEAEFFGFHAIHNLD